MGCFWKYTNFLRRESNLNVYFFKKHKHVNILQPKDFLTILFIPLD